MRLNSLRPGAGSKHAPKRVGRGIGSGLVNRRPWPQGAEVPLRRTVNPGFEGGQMPIQRRLPKFGFTSRQARYVLRFGCTSWRLPVSMSSIWRR